MDDFDDPPEPVNLSVWFAPVCALLLASFAVGAWVGTHLILAWKP